MRDEWSCAITRLGAPSVMDSGQPMMPMWPADNWDLQTVVCKISCISEFMHINTLGVAVIYVTIN